MIAELALAAAVLYPLPGNEVDSIPGPGYAVELVLPAHGDGHWVRALDGEGLIALTTRTCGAPDHWRSVAHANFIEGPDYGLTRGQRLIVWCTP